jgi:uncharacterized protein YdaU (DUF1376 family)
VNYYEHHLGDYAEATAHLSFIEDAAYSRLIRKYYSTESPLPSDLKVVQRLVGARDKTERLAVDTVLKEFFELREDGWHNTRCDEEIEKARARIAAARENGKKGGRPPSGNNPPGSSWDDKQEPTGLSLGTPEKTQVKALHTPDPILHVPPVGDRSSLTPTEVDTSASENGHGQLTPEAALAIPLRKEGVKVSSIHPTLVAWVKDGFSFEQVMGAVGIARELKGDAEIHAKYLDSILRDPNNKPRLNGSTPSRKLTRYEQSMQTLGETHDVGFG